MSQMEMQIDVLNRLSKRMSCALVPGVIGQLFGRGGGDMGRNIIIFEPMEAIGGRRRLLSSCERSPPH